MAGTRFNDDRLRSLFEHRQIASLPELKAALGTEVSKTVFRKLAALSYLSSYSHRGAYYTLPAIPRFDTNGLWCYQEVWFSRHGTLRDTLVASVTESPSGYFASELRALLHVQIKRPLRTLVENGRLSRHNLGVMRWLYCAADPERQAEQLRARQSPSTSATQRTEETVTNIADHKAAVLLFYGLLDEQQRRLFAGLESLRCGHGGDTLLARLLDLAPETVARGRSELLSGKVQRQRVRAAGGGRRRTGSAQRSG